MTTTERKVRVSSATNTERSTTGDRTKATAETAKASIWRQPVAVWAIAFACTVSFMGIGLVDPILPAISRELDATPSETMLLFTSYLFITGIVMLFASWVSSRLGVKKTLLAGLALIVVFAAAAGLSGGVVEIIGFRAGWGIGNALFIATALAAIVGAASGGSRQAIVLYEASLGIGLAVGPLLGGALGELSWRGPFFGTAALMAIALLAILVVFRSPAPAAGSAPAKVSFLASFRALRNPALLTLSLTAFFYNVAFFVLLAYSPYPIESAAAEAGMTFGAHELGLVFFGWGLAVALTSVLAAPVLTRRWGLRPVLFTMLGLLAVAEAVLAIGIDSAPVLIVTVIVAGLFLGVLNTALTEAVMEATDLPRNVASGTYSGVRFIGGAIAPAVAGPLAAALSPSAPYWLGVAALIVAIAILAVAGRTLSHLGRPHEDAVAEAADIGQGDA